MEQPQDQQLEEMQTDGFGQLPLRFGIHVFLLARVKNKSEK